jgi:hypothetical protein
MHDFTGFSVGLFSHLGRVQKNPTTTGKEIRKPTVHGAAAKPLRVGLVIWLSE